MLAGLHKLVDELERDRSLLEFGHFRERVEALDRLDAYDLNFHLMLSDAGEDEALLCHRATELRAKLEDVNRELYESVREAIRRGDGRDALMRWASDSESKPALRNLDAVSKGDTYDYLDELVSDVLQFAAPDSVTIELSSEMVAYQPTPAHHVFELIRNAEFAERDVFIDLGSGLGHVPLLVTICTKARSVGVELEPTYVESARRSAKELNLNNAAFLAQDARNADLSDGTIFYLYTPFRGAILRTVLDRLRAEANQREIRVCTFGPCSPIVAAESWLVRDPAKSGHVVVFRSKKQKRICTGDS